MALNSEPEKAQSCLSLALTYSEVNTRYVSPSPTMLVQSQVQSKEGSFFELVPEKEQYSN